MCSRFTQRFSWREVHTFLRLGTPAPALNLRPRYNLAPSQNAAVVRDEDGERRLSMLRWGLIPVWAKDPIIGHKLINARAESAAVKPSFRAVYSKRRCLVPADGFYEWRREGEVRQPWLIAPRDGGIVAFAGLWERWRVPERAVLRGSLAELRSGDIVDTFTIFTTEPARLMDVTRIPWCFPNLGGLTIDPGLPAARGRTGSSGGDGAKGSVWHAHYYVYPLLSWIGALIDLGCLEGGSLDIAWTSELDPAWLDDELSFLLNPEAALFANLPAQAACAADCAASSAGLPLDPMFWCAGCQGGMYPLTGNVAAHVGGVQASLLAAQRLVYRLHRAGLAWGTFGSGALCGRFPMPVMRKSQYRWQMTQPVPATSPVTGCNPTGRSSVLWETLREVPVSGESFGYLLLWAKRNCCVL